MAEKSGAPPFNVGELRKKNQNPESGSGAYPRIDWPLAIFFRATPWVNLTQQPSLLPNGLPSAWKKLQKRST
jgi:hypothetical protein